ncbi:MAG: methyl-accepting chemotaxis protein [Spirochaetaceae bacterium]
MIGKSEVSADRLAELARQVEENLAESTETIRDINEDIHVLSINAKIEAARAGTHGNGFTVVADRIQKLVSRTNTVIENMETQVSSLMQELSVMSDQLTYEVRGQRYQQIAYNAVDIIDRNLYERSCDVRWWATDDSVVRALTDVNAETAETASRRLGVILDSYTVYFDLVLADRDGRIIANGRPAQFSSAGRNVGDLAWFQRALKTRNGDDFAEQSVHESNLVRGEEVLAYSTAVRESGLADGRVIGALGILFRWHDLADTALNRAVEGIKTTEGEDASVQMCITSGDGLVLAQNEGGRYEAELSPSLMTFMKEHPNGHGLREINGRRFLISCARSPGYETYTSDRHCICMQGF